MSNTERAEFERTLAGEAYGGILELISDHWDAAKGEYKLFQHQVAWVAWQAARRAPVVPACAHCIVDARNPVVKSGYMCIDCGALFSAADHDGLAPAAPQPPEAQ